MKDFEVRCEKTKQERLEERRKKRIEERKQKFIEEKKQAAIRAAEEKARLGLLIFNNISTTAASYIVTHLL